MMPKPFLGLFCFGKISKKLLIPFIFAFAEILLHISSDFFPTLKRDCSGDFNTCRITSQLMETFAASLGEISLMIIPYINLFSINDNGMSSKKKISRLKIFCHFFGICFMLLLIISLMFFSYGESNKINFRPPAINGLFT